MKAMTLRTQLVLLQVVIVLVLVLTVGLAAMLMQERQIREASQERMIAVAQSVAQLPTIVDSYDDDDPAAVIQPIAELIRDSSNVAYVVVTDDEGIRFSHPNADRIGEPVSTDPSVALSGDMYVGTQTGTLGESWRVKVPVFSDGTVIGQVSVGILESDLRADFMGDITGFLLALGAATVIGVVAATGVARIVRRRIYGLEPDEIRGLLETREATLHGIREGMLALDEEGRVSLCNDSAARLLGLSSPVEAIGRSAAELVDDLTTLIAEADGANQRLLLSGERVLVARAAPVRVQDRRVGTVVTLMDRTELDHALRDLAGAQSLAEGLRAQHHEFSNTLHTIGGLIELGEIDAARRVIDRAGDGGALSRLDAPDGVQDIELAAVLLAKRARARELGVLLTISDDCRLPAGPGDGDLGTVVGNLLDNAMDAAGHGGNVAISIAQDDESNLQISVEDDGPGVPIDRRGDVFRLGYSTKSDDRQRGYGLTLVARIVERRHGSVELSPSDSGGARFTVRIPAIHLVETAT
ncbi:ATP-binding protein [Microbacterium sp. A93]|uniref:ATP-binding protein n=1 Tax=Microbacterium sp. A93 TaxID=3450716 RepID=UPI003F41F538